MPRSGRGRGRQSQHSLTLPDGLTGRPAGQRRRGSWILFAVLIGWELASSAVFTVSPPAGVALLAAPVVVLFVVQLAGAGPRRHAQEAARAERKAEHRAWLASFRHADIPPEVIELIARRQFTPARERYEQLTGAHRAAAEYVLNAYQIDAALARTAAAARREIPPEVVDLIIAGQRAQAAARYSALRAVPLDEAVAVLDTFPDRRSPLTLGLVEETLLGQAVMGGNDGRVGGHDQECPPGNLLQVAAETENETGDKVDDARGIRLLHVLQVDDDRNLLAVVIADGGGIPKDPRAHNRDMDAVGGGVLGTRDLLVVQALIEVLGKVPVLVGRGAIIKRGETEPITGAALHYADLRRYGPILGRRSGETTVDDGNRSEPDCTKL
jgi:hypothetical protein